jgi:hypothetical protein
MLPRGSNRKERERVNRSKLWNILIGFGLSISLVNAAKSSYDNTNIFFNKENTDMKGTRLDVN